MTAVAKVGGDLIRLVPTISKVGGVASRGSRLRRLRLCTYLLAFAERCPTGRLNSTSPLVFVVYEMTYELIGL